MKQTITSQADWQAGILPPQADAVSSPGDVKLYRPAPAFSRASAAYLPDGTQVAAAVARYWWGRWQNRLSANQADIEVSLSGIGAQDGATVTRITTEAWNGTASAMVDCSTGTSAGSGVVLSQFTLEQGCKYTFSAYVKGTAGKSVRLVFRSVTGGYISTSAAFVLNGQWQRFSHSFTPGTTQTDCLLRVTDGDGTKPVFYVDGLQLEEGDLTKWRPGGTGKGIMVEESTTNLVLHSEDFTGASWTREGFVGTRTANAAMNPYGLPTADQINSTAGYLYYKPASVLPNTTYTFSCWIRSATGADISGSGIAIWVYDGAGGSKRRAVSDDRTVTTQWKRFVVTYTTAPDETSASFLVAGSTPTLVQPLNVYVWGAQLETKAYATSYMPTSGGTASRSPETLTIPTTGLSPAQGCVRMWVSVTSLMKQPIVGRFPTVFGIPRSVTNITNIGIWLYHDDDTPNWSLQVRSDTNAVYTATVTDTVTDLGMHLFEVKWIGSVVKLVIDGVVRGTIPNAVMPSGFLPAYLGYSNVGAYANTYFDDLETMTHYPSDAESLAAYQRTSPPVSTANTLALLHMDGTLVSDYPSQATVVTRELDLGSIPITRPIFLSLTSQAGLPASVSASVTRCRSRASQDAPWGPWLDVMTLPTGGVITATAPQRYFQVEIVLATVDPAQTPVLQALTVTDDTDFLYVRSDGRVDPIGLWLLRDSEEDMLPGYREETEAGGPYDRELDFSGDLEPRTLELRLHSPGNLIPSELVSLRSMLAAYLNPRRGALRFIREDDPDRYLVVRTTGTPSLQTGADWLEATVPLKAHDPMYLGTALQTLTGSGIATCNGNRKTPAIVRIKGPVTNPSVTVAGITFTWTGTVGANDELVVDGERLTVTFNGVNALAGFTGSFPVFTPGANSVTAAAGGTTTTTWRDRWI